MDAFRREGEDLGEEEVLPPPPPPTLEPVGRRGVVVGVRVESNPGEPLATPTVALPSEEGVAAAGVEVMV